MLEKIKYTTKVDIESFTVTITFKEPVTLNVGDKLFIEYENLEPIFVAIRRKNSS